MKKRLCTGLINPSNALISILDSIGIWYEKVDFSVDLAQQYSVLLIEEGSELDNQKRDKIQSFKEQNLGVLEISEKPLFFSGPSSTVSKTHLFNNKSDSEFDRVSHIDVYSKCTLSKSKTALFSGLVDHYETNSILIGLNLNSVFFGPKYKRKRFYSNSYSFPDEIVSQESRDSITHIIELSIQRLFHVQNLPFVKKWSSPQEKPVFGFRIDTDYGDRKSLDAIYDLLNKHSLKASWFVHTKAHQGWLDYFNTLENQEIAVHCYEHGTSDDLHKLSTDVDSATKRLRETGIDFHGYCAPYGIWNSAVNLLMNKQSFEYSSEFTSGYDCLPFFNEGHLQIPIHPICTGSMNRKKYSIEQMENYFLSVYELKRSFFKPILFYHHPMQIGLEVFDSIFEKVNADDLTNLSFLEFARFWKRRHKHKFSAYIEDDILKIDSDNSDLFLYVSRSADAFQLIRQKQEISLSSFKSVFKYGPPSLPSPDELKRLYGNPIELIKTSFYDWKNRNVL